MLGMLFFVKKRRNTRRPKHNLRLVLLLLLSFFLLLLSSRLFLSLCGYGQLATVSDSDQLHFKANNTDTLKTPTHRLDSSSSSTNAAARPSPAGNIESVSDPYHDWKLFVADFEEMIHNFKIYVYGDALVSDKNSFAHIFVAHPNPFNPKLGNYFSEHMFKTALLGSSLITKNPQEAHLFFLPFSINNLRNEPRVHSEAAISEFVAEYTKRISRQLPFWNASGGADHFYVCCHSVGREAASKHPHLHNNAIQVACSSNYFQRLYISHKDVALPQVWPRNHHFQPNPPHARDRLAYFAGRVQNSQIRQQLIALWGNDSDMDVFPGSPPFPYEQGFRKSKYCLHVKGYEVNTARVSDAIHYGCIPVIISNYYDLPFANVLDWTKFSVIINQRELPLLKRKLLSITKQNYLSMYRNLFHVQRHFIWHTTPMGYDSFHMTAYQLWLRRSMHRLPHQLLSL